MKRRNFLHAVAATSACALAGSAAAGRATANETEKVRCRITVLKKTLNEVFVVKYRVEPVGVCPVFREGAVFDLDSPWVKPEGFCDWAWADIRTFVQLVHAGRFNTFVSCCTDGYRPVFFKIERVVL